MNNTFTIEDAKRAENLTKKTLDVYEINRTWCTPSDINISELREFAGHVKDMHDKATK